MLLGETSAQIFIRPLKGERILEQSKRMGLDSLPLVFLVSLFTGMILALQTAYMMKRLGSEIYIANIIFVSLVRELGPVLISLIIAGRMGAAITAEIGTMKITEQIDALKSLAVNPIKFLVVPRFLSLLFILPLLVIYGYLVGILGGFFICVYRLGIGPRLYLDMGFGALSLKDIFSGLIKSVFFAMIIALVSCFEGLKVEGGAEGVGRATTQSVVITFMLIIAFDCLFSALFYFVF